jgi:hypothetical protein
MLLNGPESFTPDGNFILGEAPELRNYFVCAGFNSAGIANSGGAGRLMAEWIVGGEPAPTCGTWTSAASALHRQPQGAGRAHGETLGLHYAMRWPRQELETARPLRTSPLYDILAGQGRGVRQQEWVGAGELFPAGRVRPSPTTRSAGPTGSLDD